jgi:hypothetical protein
MHSRYIHRLNRYHGSEAQQLLFYGAGDGVEAITLHFPFTHPHLPAPQSIGPSQLIVHNTLQAPLYALLMQLVGWQHSAGTQSSPVVQSCSPGGGVVTSVVGSGGTGVGVTVPGGVLEMHPPAMTRPAVKRSTIKSKRDCFMTMLRCFMREDDNFLGRK